VAGHVPVRQCLSEIENLFRRRSLRLLAPRSRKPRLSRPRGHQDLLLKSRRGLGQAHLCLGVEGPSQSSGRRYAANLLDIVLGGGMSSRLFQEVREKRGLAYSIASSLNSFRLGGYETIYAACAPKNLGRLLEVTLRELKRLKHEGVRPRELAWAKENLKGNMMLALESTVSRMSMQARQEFYFGRVFPAEEMIARVETVSAGDVAAEAGRLFNGRMLSLAVVGNVGKLPISAPDLAAAL
jgi:predicted Zn-dependent peptidase